MSQPPNSPGLCLLEKRFWGDCVKLEWVLFYVRNRVKAASEADSGRISKTGGHVAIKGVQDRLSDLSPRLGPKTWKRPEVPHELAICQT